jgi:MoaA/NifB/PqqE/SkfB family radical SAM enzyme
MDEGLYHNNLRLSQLEYQLQHIHLRSRPRCLGLVLGNACNIDCIHCYQAKNGDNLLRPTEIGKELRREFIGIYPYLSTLRVQGGEVFAYAGFRDLLDDIEGAVSRPILSVSTNGTLIDESWAERIVRMPFARLTVSLDGGTSQTFARLRVGGQLDSILANVRRIQRWKEKLGSDLPYLDSFFVVMRSNFREIPDYLRLMREYGIGEVALQTVEINRENLSRWPDLERYEMVADPAEVRELYGILHDVLPRERPHFRMIRASGLRSLFEPVGLDSAFLLEEVQGLYPNSDDLAKTASENGAPSFDLCPNPWTTLFVAENGDVHLCFLAEPVGNLYEAPLASIWNSQRAVAKRSQMIAGNYLASGCSERYCSWREGKTAGAVPLVTRELLVEIKHLKSRVLERQPEVCDEPLPTGLGAVRRMVDARNRRIAELESLFQEMCAADGKFHETGQKYIDELETKVAELEGLLERGQAHIDHLESGAVEAGALLQRGQAHIDHLEAKERKSAGDLAHLQDEFTAFRKGPMVRVAHKISRALEKLTGQ